MSLFGMFDLRREIEAQAARSAGKIETRKPLGFQQEVRMLEANLAKALMIAEALWELVRDKLGLTEEDLNDKLYAIDMRDGQLDGKNERAVAECPQCRRNVSRRHPACLYCGTLIDDSVFRLTR